MAKIKIKQIRSRISRPANEKKVLDALGLTRIGRVVEHEDTPQIMGMLARVSHLVEVER
ncbi:MAG TPA: 50S ribosomal protein L30 [Porphyromonadaceae bacterium]|nr:50S ribosomal protein L30 [Porphyromonadaceae bacterium]